MTDLTHTLDQIEDACEAATEGPWETRENFADDDPDEWYCTDILYRPEGEVFGGHPQVIAFAELATEDAAFIAMARTALPELAAKVRELEESRSRALRNVSEQAMGRAKAEAALARVQGLTGWTSVGRDTNGVDRLVPASEILEALKETP